MPRYALRLSYDGQNFCGWFPQPQQRSVATHCNQALRRLGENQAECIGSSRTDAGVHATAQVAHVDCQRDWPALELLRALNQQFDSDLCCTAIAEVAADWHSIYHCQSKTYRYSLDAGAVANPLHHHYTWRCPQVPQLADLQKAAACIPGRHDWKAFARSNDTRSDFVRDILSAQWFQEGSQLHCDIHGTGFTYRLVRSLVGAMIGCANKQCTAHDLIEAVAGTVTSASSFQAPAHGLCLTAIEHHPHPVWQLPTE